MFYFCYFVSVVFRTCYVLLNFIVLCKFNSINFAGKGLSLMAVRKSEVGIRLPVINS